MERRRDERELEMSEWTRGSLERRDYLRRRGVSEEVLSEWGESKLERLRERDLEVDEQERGERVLKLRSCADYERVNRSVIPQYIRMNKRREGKKLHTIARWRCGNEIKGNKYWINEEERKCRLCGKGKK